MCTIVALSRIGLLLCLMRHVCQSCEDVYITINDYNEMCMSKGKIIRVWSAEIN